MAYTTKLDLTKQSRIDLNTQATYQGSISVGQRFFISSVEINPTSAQPNDVLTYDPLTNSFNPEPSSNTLFPQNRVVFGMELSGNTNNALNFEVTSGLYTIDNTFYPFSGYNFTINSGDTLYDRYDLVYVSGGTTPNTAYVIEGIPASSPIIPIPPSSGITLGIIVVPAGLSITGSSSTINPTFINATNVTYSRGIYTNVSDFLDGNYIFPLITDFTNDINSLQYGQSASTINFIWNSNKTGYQYNLNPTGGTYNNATYNYSLINQIITGNTSNSAATYTLTFDDGIGTTNAYSTIYFYNKRYYGTNSGITLTNSDIINLEYNEFDYNTNKFNIKQLSGGSKYIYFCYPVRQGLSNFFVNGMYSNDFDINTQSFTNPFGFTEQYYVIKTSNIIYTNKIYFESR